MPTAKSYRRVMLGRKSIHAAECFAGNFVGAGFGINEDLTGHLPDSWRDFNKEYVAEVDGLSIPGKSKISAGLSCGALWVVCKGLKSGDIVLAPPTVLARIEWARLPGTTEYVPGGNLPHRRPVRWLDVSIPRDSMSEGSYGTPPGQSARFQRSRRMPMRSTG